MSESLSEQITCRMITKPALHMMEANLPSDLIDKVNAYIDTVSESANDYSFALVGQIRKNEKSAQLQMDLQQKIPAALAGVIVQIGTEYVRGQGFGADVTAKRYVERS